MSLALVRAGVGPALHIGVEQPVDDEERSLDPSDFAESDGQFVLARIGRELFIPAGAALSVRGRPADGAVGRPDPRQTGASSVSYEWYGNNCGSGTLSVHFPP